MNKLLQKAQKMGKMVLDTVSTGSDGNEAVALYEKHRPDLITLDVSMPNKRGTDAVKEIIAKYPDAKIIMISAIRGNDLTECLSYGAKGYMEKPLRLDDPQYIADFVQTLREVIPEIAVTP